MYRRMVPRLGHAQTIGAIAHRQCRLIWLILHQGVRYEERGPAVTKQSKQKRTARILRQLRNLGYRIEPANPQPSKHKRSDFRAWWRSEGASQRVVLADGSTTYNTSLIRQASERNGESFLALTSANVLAGLYALSSKTLNDIIGHCPMETTRSLEELDEAIRSSPSVVSVNVSDELWQRLRTEEDRCVAERKLDRWLVKPTDGRYAQLNRRMSIAISRQLIKFPITANMVSIFTLGMGIASASFFALGGYWHTLVGALLCLFASILDGCDGEVARLKLLESDFGCWLETGCDYLFYFFLLVGMTIGQWRSSASDAHLVWGGFLLMGALASFFTVRWQRRRLAAGRPEQLLRIWHSRAERRSSNPFFYAARHVEFMARRCFFPYAVAFALLGIMKAAFILSVINANLVWPVALYSLRTFSEAKPAVGASTASA